MTAATVDRPVAPPVVETAACERCGALRVQSARYCSIVCAHLSLPTPTRDALLAALAGGEWRTMDDLAQAVYRSTDKADRAAIRLAVFHARRAGVLIETRLSHRRQESASYRLVGEGS